MKLTKQVVANLRLLGEWKNIQTLSIERGRHGGSFREQVMSMAHAGLLDSQTIVNPSKLPNAHPTTVVFRRSQFGDRMLAEFDKQLGLTPAPVVVVETVREPVQQRTGSNPFEWRSYKQPVELNRMVGW